MTFMVAPNEALGRIRLERNRHRQTGLSRENRLWGLSEKLRRQRQIHLQSPAKGRPDLRGHGNAPGA